MTIALYPGSFDPITLGHVGIVTRASRLFEQIVMAVAKNPDKQSFIPVSERVALVQAATESLTNVTVQSFEGLTVNFAAQVGAGVIIRGLRAVSDFEFEFKMSQMNKILNPSVEMVFMMADLEYQFLSSSVVREVATLGGDISSIVPPPVQQYLSRQRVPEIVRKD